MKYYKKLRLVARKTRTKFRSIATGPTISLPSKFMMLPIEIRQKILLQTYNCDYIGHNSFIDFMLLRKQHIHNWSINLRKVHPDIDAEMGFVEQTWENRLTEIQDELWLEFNYVWNHLLFKENEDLTPQQIQWVMSYRRTFVELGARADRLLWEADHHVLKHVRRVPGLRRHIGVDERKKALERYEIMYLEIGWHVVNGGYGDTSSFSSSGL